MPNPREVIALAVGALCEAYGRTPSEATIQGYVWGLEGVPVEDIQRAVKAALQTCRWMPTPAELREIATQGSQTLESRALSAWTVVDDATSRYTGEDSIDFADPLINAAIRSLGGWRRICTEVPLSEFHKWLRKDFIEAYTRLSRSPPDVSLCAALGAPESALRIGVPYRLGAVHLRLTQERRQLESVRDDIPRVEFRRVDDA